MSVNLLVAIILLVVVFAGIFIYRVQVG